MKQELPAASLFYREGSSDKEYHTGVATQGGGYVVTFAYGRRGSTLNTGTKTQSPVSLAEASMIWQKLVAEKERKGYRRAGAVAQAPARPVAKALALGSARLLPQLLNPIDETALDAFVAGLTNQWGAQPKYDGKRILLGKKGKELFVLNRSGGACGIAMEVIEYAQTLPGNFMLDGEAIGPDYYAFDLLERDGEDFRALAYGTRYNALLKIIGHPNGWPIHPAPLVIGAKNVQKFLAELRAKNAEGIVFKDLLAPYMAGRPNSGGPQLKCKFYATCSAVVIMQNEKRSVGLALHVNPTEGLCIGNVTVPPNHKLPEVGTVVEIRYLYAYKGGALYQPVYLGARDDVPATDCTVEKQRLKYKAEAE